MRNPVVITSGNTYEKKAIIDFLARGLLQDPETKQGLKMALLIPNKNLKIAIERFLEENQINEEEELIRE